ncbi:hypothetical protein LWI29_003594 [Acer saccharum]|uniref:Uncharacterized protein n=1 Tax=Acer saccharum TaxID=4024 RepID=A0AA39RUV1_ACESA|nr:hypothetical protein LWI29_003594 [Acer saccharum]
MQMYQAVIDSINEMSLQGDDQEQQAELLYAYETSISGFAAKLSTKHLQSLEKVDGFLSATPDQLLQLHTTISQQFLSLQTGKVCWIFGCSNADMLAAIDKAIQDGVDVLSISLGSGPLPFNRDILSIDSFGAIKSGVFVSCSAGNLGPYSSYLSNSAPCVMTVAASYMNFPSSYQAWEWKSC